VRVEYWGEVHGEGKDAIQILECRITTPKRTLTNGWAIGQLPPVEEGEKRSNAQAAFAKAQLYLSQKADVKAIVATAREHMSGVRYIEQVERLVEELEPEEKEAQAIELLTAKLKARVSK
jgi:hypothetical protein